MRSTTTRRIFPRAAAGAACVCALFLATTSSWALDGTLDPTFGTNGIATTDFLGQFDTIESIHFLSDSSFLTTGEGANSRAAVAHFSPNGQRDTSFAGGGLSGTGTLSIPESLGQPFGVGVSPTGLVVGYAGVNNDGFYFGATRVTTGGSIDTSFGNQGVGRAPAGAVQAAAFAREVQQADGKLIVAGSQFVNNGWDFMVSRFNSNGTLDSTFGSQGSVLTDFSRTQITSPIDRASALAIQPDGKILVGGFSSTTGQEATNNRIHAVARYLPNGTLDSTFGTGGKETFTFGTGSLQDNVGDILVLPNGKILLSSNGGSDTGLVQLLPNGVIDSSFGTGGRVVDASFNAWRDPADILLDQQGRILVAGGNQSLEVARFTANGTLDPTFATAGQFTLLLPGESSGATALAIGPDGKILVGGVHANVRSSNEDIVLVRLENFVPEPSSFVLAGAAAACFALRYGLRLRRKT